MELPESDGRDVAAQESDWSSLVQKAVMLSTPPSQRAPRRGRGSSRPLRHLQQRDYEGPLLQAVWPQSQCKIGRRTAHCSSASAQAWRKPSSAKPIASNASGRGQAEAAGLACVEKTSSLCMERKLSLRVDAAPSLRVEAAPSLRMEKKLSLRMDTAPSLRTDRTPSPQMGLAAGGGSSALPTAAGSLPAAPSACSLKRPGAAWQLPEESRRTGSRAGTGATSGHLRSAAAGSHLGHSRPGSSAAGVSIGGNAVWSKAAPDEGDTSLSPGDSPPLRAELMRLRKRVHLQACELQYKRSELEMAQRELRQAQQAHDELRLKHNNLERIEQKMSGTLLDERRKNDELSRQVAAMSQNLMSLCSSMETGAGHQQTSGMQKQCFKLVQLNTQLTVKYALLRRQKGWAEAKARVLEREVASVYLHKNDCRVQDENAQLAPVESELLASLGWEEEEHAGGYLPLMPLGECRDEEAVLDFLSHVVRSRGRDLQSLLHAPRVTSEAIRKDLITGLGREFYALWRFDRRMPEILRAVEHIVHLGDYLEAFEGIASAIMALLGCMGVRMWIVDSYCNSMWTCSRGAGEVPFTQACSLPRSQASADLAGKGLAVAACMTEAVVCVANVREDQRFNDAADDGGECQTRSELCVPIMRSDKSKTKVAIVMQAMNKLLEPRFDMDFDGEVLLLIGRVALEVCEVCKASAAQRVNAKRKEAQLQIFDDHLPCTDPGHLLHSLETGLHKMFRAQAVALTVISSRRRSEDYPTLQPRQRGTILPTGPQGGAMKAERPSTAMSRRLLRVPREDLRGIIGHVAMTQAQTSFSHSQLEESMYDPMADLPVPDGMVHTVPICQDGVCTAICQFVCPQREGSMLVDDGCFHVENPEHTRLLQLILTFVRRHLCVFAVNPPPPLAEGRVEEIQDEDEGEEEMLSGFGEDLDPFAYSDPKEWGEWEEDADQDVEEDN